MSLLLFALFLSAQAVFGAARWFQVGVLFVQPTEFAKIAAILLLARYFETNAKSAAQSALDHFCLSLGHGTWHLDFVATELEQCSGTDGDSGCLAVVQRHSVEAPAFVWSDWLCSHCDHHCFFSLGDSHPIFTGLPTAAYRELSFAGPQRHLRRNV